MSFIELTSYDTGRTLHVRAERIVCVVDYVNDDRGEKYTKVSMNVPDDEYDLHVVETPEEVLRRISGLELQEAKETTAQLSAIRESLSDAESKGTFASK